MGCAMPKVVSSGAGATTLSKVKLPAIRVVTKMLLLCLSLGALFESRIGSRSVGVVENSDQYLDLVNSWCAIRGNFIRSKSTWSLEGYMVSGTLTHVPRGLSRQRVWLADLPLTNNTLSRQPQQAFTTFRSAIGHNFRIFAQPQTSATRPWNVQLS